MREVSVTILGVAQTARVFEAPAENAADLVTSFNAIMDAWEQDVAAQFRTKGRTFGTPWAPLARSTLAAKARRGEPSDPLVASGELRASFKRGGSGHVRRIRRDGVEWGSSDPKLAFHQDGAGRMHRPVFQLDAEREREAFDLIGGHVFGAGDGSFTDALGMRRERSSGRFV